MHLWRMDRNGAAHRSPLLSLDCNRNSPGLQAIVRLWCTPASEKGYVAPQLPCSIVLRDRRRLEDPNLIMTSGSTADEAAGEDVSCVVEGTLKPDNTQAVAKTTSSELRMGIEVGCCSC